MIYLPTRIVTSPFSSVLGLGRRPQNTPVETSQVRLFAITQNLACHDRCSEGDVSTRGRSLVMAPKPKSIADYVDGVHYPQHIFTARCGRHWPGCKCRARHVQAQGESRVSLVGRAGESTSEVCDVRRGSSRAASSNTLHRSRCNGFVTQIHSVNPP